MDINQIVSLGIGTPADVPHFILLGLSPTGAGTLLPDNIIVATLTSETPIRTLTFDG